LSLALLLCAAAGQATPLYSKDDFKIDFSGYIQEQWLDSGDFLGASFDLFQTRLRPVFDFNFGKGFSAEVSQTLLFSSGNALDNPLYKLSQDAAPPTYFRWDKRLVNDNEAWLDWSVYRAWAAYENDKMKVTLGRQRIAFGSALFYSPLDVFNPVSPLSLEPGERVGVDGVDCEIELGPSSYFSLAYGIGNVIDQSRFAAYYKTTVKTTDLHFLAARIFADWIAGAAFASNVKQGKLYGEASYTWPEQGKNYFRGTIGYQYNFSNGLLLTTEYYHNDGVIHASALGLADASAIFTQTNALATVDRNFLGVSAGFDLTELIRFNSALLLDLDAGSFYIGPSFSFSAPHSIALEAGAQLFSGNGKGDFGLLPDFDWARIRWDF
jgi:hypothetical protein